jgi:hypothetical protein
MTTVNPLNHWNTYIVMTTSLIMHKFSKSLWVFFSNHAFDLPERTRGTRKRKSGNVSKPEEPARKPQTVREYHRAHEAKILPHVRRGIYLQDD